MRRLTIAFALTLLGAFSDARAASVLVETVRPQWGAAIGDVRAGDALVSIEGSKAPADIWGVIQIQVEREMVAPTRLIVARARREVSLTLPSVTWGTEFRPELASAEEPLLRKQNWTALARRLEAKGDFANAGWAWMRASERALRARDYTESRRLLDEALSCAGRSSDTRAAALMWMRRGAIAVERWSSTVAADAFGEARSVLSSTENASKAHAVLSLRAGAGLAEATLLRRDLIESERLFTSALREARAIAPVSLLATDALRGLTLIALERRDLPRTAELRREVDGACIDQCRRTLQYAEVLRSEGSLMMLRGDSAKASVAWQQALDIAAQLAPEQTAHARHLNGMGTAAWRDGRLAEAEAYYQHALAIAGREAPGTILEAGSLMNLGGVHHLRFDYVAAQRAYQRSVDIFTAISPTSAESARALTNLAMVAGVAGDAEAALQALLRVLSIQQNSGAGASDIAHTYHGLGLNYHRLNNLVEAERSYRTAIEQREKLGIGGLPLAGSVQSRASVLRDMGRHEEAAEEYRRALRVHERLAPDGHARAEALYWLGIIERDQGRLGAAAELMRQAIAVIESQQLRLGGTQEARTSYAAHYAHFYKDYMDVLWRLRREQETFETLERYRARVLRAMYAERDASARLPGELVAERERLAADYEAAIGALQAIDKPDTRQADVDQLLQRLEGVRDRLGSFIARVRAAAPAAAAVRYPAPFEIESLHAVPGGDAALVSFGVTEHRLYVFVVERGPGTRVELSTHATEIDQQVLGERIAAWRTLLAAPKAGADARRALDRQGHELYRLLLGPVAPRLARYRKLLVIPDGPLHEVPFAALVSRFESAGQPRYVVQDFAISTAVSAALMEELRARSGSRDRSFEFVAFADSRGPAQQASARIATPLLRSGSLGALPWSREEASSVAALFGEKARVFIGSDATQARVIEHAPRSRIVHFATHAVLDERAPLDSYLALAPSDTGDRLRAAEIFDRSDFEADLVTLSACATGGGKESAGEGLIGLTRAFHYAGARTVLSSLWPVNDRSTSELMVTFYRGLFGETAAGLASGAAGTALTKDEALRRAQEAMLAPVDARNPLRRLLPGAGRYSHPFYWAPFQLSGAGL